MLREALGAAGGELKIGVIAALGIRRDRAATEPLIAMLAGADQTLVLGKNLIRVENAGFLRRFLESSAAWFVG